jgi:hypothetical protein
MALNTPLQSGEAVIKEAGASLQRGPYTVDGHLYLTDNRLIFEPHEADVQPGPLEIPVMEIDGLEKCRPKLLGLIPTGPEAMRVTTKDGECHSFVVNKGALWVGALRQQQGTDIPA